MSTYPSSHKIQYFEYVCTQNVTCTSNTNYNVDMDVITCKLQIN